MGGLWKKESAQALPDGFRYTSDSNPQRLTSEELRELIAAESPTTDKLRVVEPQRASA